MYSLRVYRPGAAYSKVFYFFDIASSRSLMVACLAGRCLRWTQLIGMLPWLFHIELSNVLTNRSALTLPYP
jgi:hypothetical protein